MYKISYALLACFLLAAGHLAHAADSMPKNAMQSEGMNKEAMPGDAMKKESMDGGMMKKEGMAQDKMGHMNQHKKGHRKAMKNTDGQDSMQRKQ